MYLIRGIGNIEAFKKKFPNQTMSGTIGNFDGLHLGHQAILNQVKEKAKASSSASLVFFTEPHASEYFALRQDNIVPPPRICPWREKVKLLKNFGIDFAFFLQFNRSLKIMTPELFLDQVLSQVNLKHLIVGDDFRFGAQRAGDFELLTEWGLQNDTEVISNSTVSFQDERISSTRIRSALLESNFKLAEQLLGRPYTFSGKVVYGQQIGRSIGIPTANLWMPSQRLPIAGVYAVKCLIEGQIHKGIANMGIRPTVGGTKPVLEIHIFDFDATVYGKRLTIEFKNKLRDEKKFDNIALLKEQILKDISKAKKILE
ncbi:bifunctional riboflavin kinase/FAD synthetase [Gammaproteobacteria bacterium]|nr:bifunctional riboflavin kinase/FAD synthetase [Gammaproteobacteria bacterium]